MLATLLIHLTAAQTLLYAAQATFNIFNTTRYVPVDSGYLERWVHDQPSEYPSIVSTPTPANRPGAITAVKSAITSLTELYRAYRLSESTSSRWSHWFQYDTLNDNWNLREVMAQWLAVLMSDTATTMLPIARPWRFGTGNW